MSWYSLFKVAQSDYGAWIAPSGEVIAVESYGHYRAGVKILKERHNIENNPDADNYDWFSKIASLGYIRLVYISFNVQFETMTDSQKKKLGGIIHQSQSNSFTFEAIFDRKFVGEQAFNKIDAMRILRKI